MLQLLNFKSDNKRMKIQFLSFGKLLSKMKSETLVYCLHKVDCQIKTWLQLIIELTIDT